jgi:hypothetical protein
LVFFFSTLNEYRALPCGTYPTALHKILLTFRSFVSVLRIRDVYPESEFFLFPDPGSASKNLGILTKKIVSKLFGNIIRVVHPGSRGQKGPGSGSATLL